MQDWKSEFRPHTTIISVTCYTSLHRFALPLPIWAI